MSRSRRIRSQTADGYESHKQPSKPPPIGKTYSQKNVPSVCYQCGCLGHTDDGCHFFEGELSFDTSDGSLQPSSFIVEEGGGWCSGPSTPMIEDGKENSVLGGAEGG